MSIRDHHVAGQPPKFSRHAQEFKNLDGTSPDWRGAWPAMTRAERRAKQRADKRAFKKALRNYRRFVIPMADKPHSFVDSWPFLVPFGLVCIGILLWQAGVFL